MPEENYDGSGIRLSPFEPLQHVYVHPLGNIIFISDRAESHVPDELKTSCLFSNSGNRPQVEAVISSTCNFSSYTFLSFISGFSG